MARVLVSRKLLDKFRFDGLNHSVAIDGTGLYSFVYEPYPGCPKKTPLTGKTTFTVYVIEAKIVCTNRFSLSISTEWIRNLEQDTYDKQDCELRSFIRLAEKIKKLYPCSPTLLLVNGLHLDNTAFDICRHYFINSFSIQRGQPKKHTGGN